MRRVESTRRLKLNVMLSVGPATELMLDLADVRTDNRLLDVGAATTGTGKEHALDETSGERYHAAAVLIR